MSSLSRLLSLIGVCLVTAVGVILFSYFILALIQDYVAKASVIVGVIALVGTIFSAMFAELASYFKDKRLVLEKKWDIIFPLVKEHYNPWLNSAKSLQNSISYLLAGDKSPVTLTRLLYSIMVFYSYRLQLIMKVGEVIIFLTVEENKKGEEIYRKVRSSLDWAGNETPIRVSQLQNLFITNNKLENPYVLYKFEQDLKSDSNLEQSKQKLGEWANSDKKLQEATSNLKEFINTYGKSIEKLYATLNV